MKKVETKSKIHTPILKLAMVKRLQVKKFARKFGKKFVKKIQKFVKKSKIQC